MLLFVFASVFIYVYTQYCTQESFSVTSSSSSLSYQRGYAACALEAFIFTQSITKVFDRKEKNNSFSLLYSFIYLHLTWWISTRKKVRKIYKRNEEEDDDDNGATNDILLFFFLFIMTHSIVHVQSFHKRKR
jgi:hypothetical protein